MDQETTTAPPLSIVEVIQSLDGGGDVERLKEELEQVVRDVKARGGKGSVTLTMNVESFSDVQVVIKAKITSKSPDTQPGPTIFFTTDEGHLTRKDPSQMPLFGNPR